MEHVATLTSRSNVDSGCTRDHTSKFKAAKRFKSKEDLRNWARDVGRLNGFTIVVLKSDSGKGKKKPRVILGCERSGKCDIRSTSKRTMTDKCERRRTGTKKCDCPFRLMGEKLAAGDEWELKVVEGMHNHEALHTGKGHSFQGRLSQEEKSLLKDLWKGGMQPVKILRALQQRDEHNKSTLRTIYNGCQRLKRIQQLKDESYGWQQLMSKADEYKFIKRHRTRPKTDTVLDFFFTHPTSLELLLAFPTVLIIVFLPLEYSMWATLEITAVTSTDDIFFVASAILSSECESSCRWALNTLQGIMDYNGNAMPDIVTFSTLDADKMIPLMKAINDVFSTAKRLLSTDFIDHWAFPPRWHNWFKPNYRWDSLVASPTRAQFEQHLMQLRTELSMHPEALEYVEDTLLKPCKEMFVPAWTDKVMHFGNAHRRIWGRSHDIITRHFEFKGSVVVKQIDGFWKCMQGLIEGSLKEVRDSFVISLTCEDNLNKDWLLLVKELNGAISTDALELIHEQYMLANDIVGDHSECSCAIKCTHGLPCAHEIARYNRKGQLIPLKCINSYWRKLDMEPLRKTGSETNMDETMKRCRLSEEMNADAHSALTLLEIVESESVNYDASPSMVPSKQERQPEDKVYDIPTAMQLQFVDVCPHVLGPYIRDVKDVPRDGHCGFRAIAALLGYSEEVGWVKVRQDLTNELVFNSSHYTQLFGSDERVYELRDALAYSESICSRKYWMTMPDMGHIIASCYNVVLMHLSSVQCFTFFPLRTAPISVSKSSPNEIVIGLVEEHFVQVYLKAGHPMPPPISGPTKKNRHVATIWERFHEQRSTEWATAYLSRIEDFKSLQPVVVSQKNPIVIDID